MGSASPSGELKPFIKAPANFASPERLERHIHSLPELIDFNAQNNGDHPFCIQAKPTGELDTITHADFRIAVANCARWLKENLPLGPARSDNALTRKAPVALFMESDFGLVVHEFALLSLQIPPLVLSPRLPPVAIMHLLQATSATSLIVSQRLSVPAKPALGALEAKGVTTHIGLPYTSFVESSIDVASEENFEPPADLDEIILLLHSSGTTGMPKPIPLTHRQLLFAVNCHHFENDQEAQGLNVSSLPLFHGFGLVAPGLSMSAGKTTVYPGGIPTATSILELIRVTNAKSLMTVPFLLDDVVNLSGEEGIKVLARLDFVGTGGAALGTGVGDRLAQGGVRLLNFYGTTESGPLSLTFVPKGDYDWKFFRLRTDMKYKVDELEPRNGEKRFRLTTYPYGGKGIEIADQLIRNENYPETDFAAIGRDDDVIVLANGEKTNPILLETMLSELPAVKCAVAFGENRFNLGVIIEPALPISSSEASAFKETLWPIITAAGNRMDAFSRIPSQEAILLLRPGATVPRTDKGSVARKEVYTLLATEIEEVYAKLSNSLEVDTIEPLSFENLERDLEFLFQKHWKLQIESSAWATDVSLFDLGLDSLQALQLRRVLVAAANKTEELRDADISKLIPREFLYFNPSIRQMAAALRNRRNGENAVRRNPWLDVKQFVEDFTLVQSFPQQKQPYSGRDAVIALTGSSGSLGSHILAKLSQSTDVNRIICLIRGSKHAALAPGPGQYDKSLLTSRGIFLSEEEWAKIVTVQIDPTAEKLGLDQSSYKVLQESITHVIHAAWPMNYLLQLNSFQYQFRFLQSLLHLAAQGESSTKCRFVFVSSIAAVAKIGLESGKPIIEAAVDPIDAACGIGYADAKLVCEKILESAASSHAGQLEITSVRLGQIAGSRATGAWNCTEQIPMMLRTAQSVGSLPQLSGTLSWIPVDDAAAILSEIAFSSEKLPLIQNVENPDLKVV
ncbi:Non-canonical non-ribosomal peptide synthetase ascB [Paramyrothecium foliicola]|nr:Non-canonical non-ribosomal peptide synthetase ascB [Paramyrothecium foliicola]